MNSTSAVEVICHALWPGPGPGIVEAALVCRAPLFTYASRSASRSSTEGGFASGASAARPMPVEAITTRIKLRISFFIGRFRWTGLSSLFLAHRREHGLVRCAAMTVERAADRTGVALFTVLGEVEADRLNVLTQAKTQKRFDDERDDRRRENGDEQCHEDGVDLVHHEAVLEATDDRV